jgi:hypothetical protein
MLLVEHDQTGRGWFDITDPAAAHECVTQMSATPSHLFVLANKVEQIAPFREAPYQSDYVATWTAASHDRPHVPIPNSAHTAVRDALNFLVPSEAKQWLRRKLFPGPRSWPDHFRQLP